MVLMLIGTSEISNRELKVRKLVAIDFKGNIQALKVKSFCGQFEKTPQKLALSL